jgi:radical SAM protein with 4Fe4S-binding SPASM domain
MPDSYSVSTTLPEYHLWEHMSARRAPLSFDIEVTARCNNDCAHCYINLPAGDAHAKRQELTLSEIDSIAAQAVDLGALWCLITGGEPLLRPDFPDIYLLLKRKGLLVSVFTNACLITPAHVELFRQYPPRDIEVSVYGVTRDTYEAVTRQPGSFHAFERGLDLLQAAGIPVRLKAMVLRANLHELPAIAAYCRARTHDYFRFDPLLHLRYDGDPIRNADILDQRLTPAEIAAVEAADPERSTAMQRDCDNLIFEPHTGAGCGHLFHCGAGQGSFSVRYDGYFRLCASLNHPDTLYDLRRGSLAEAWGEHVAAVRARTSDSQAFQQSCRVCPLINLCLWCPAHGHLETGHMDGHSPYFCQVAHARAANLQPPPSPPIA